MVDFEWLVQGGMCPIPTLASKLKRFCVKALPRQDATKGIKTGTKSPADAKPCQTTPARP
jgi:hypothetical protein